MSIRRYYRGYNDLTKYFKSYNICVGNYEQTYDVDLLGIIDLADPETLESAIETLWWALDHFPGWSIFINFTFEISESQLIQEYTERIRTLLMKVATTSKYTGNIIRYLPLSDVFVTTVDVVQGLRYEHIPEFTRKYSGVPFHDIDRWYNPVRPLQVTTKLLVRQDTLVKTDNEANTRKRLSELGATFI